MYQNPYTLNTLSLNHYSRRPFAKGGATETSNCQILQTRVNRWKSDKVGVTLDELRKASCSISYSGKDEITDTQ